MPHVADTVPYPWPYDGIVDPRRLAMVVAGAQPAWPGAGDPGSAERAAIEALGTALRARGGTVVWLRHGRGAPRERRALPPVVGAPEWALAVQPLAGDLVVDAGGVDGFHASALDDTLRARGIDRLVLTGFAGEAAVDSTLRSANDRGYECLTVSDAVAAVATDTHRSALSSITMSGGIFGAVGTTAAVLACLEELPMIATPAPSPSTTARVVDAEPYPWPYDGPIDASRTALVCIDWQVDFCGPGGYVDTMGYDLQLTRAGLEPTTRVLEAVRSDGWTVVHTREGHRPDLADCPPNKLWRSKRMGAGIGDEGPCGRILVRGEPGWEIVPEVAPVAGELVVDKPGKGAFYATDLDLLLRSRGITHIVLTGITTDVCVHTTMREANDRGYECLLLTDCTGATDHGNYEAACKMVTMQGGVFGAIAPSAALLTAIAP